MKKAEFIKKYGEAAWEKKIERTRQWRLNNPEKVKKYAARYREENKEEIKKARNRWLTNNAEKVKEYNLEYRNSHKEEIKGRVKEYIKQHREIRKEYDKKWKTENRDKVIEYRKNNIDKQREYNAKFSKSKIGRALKLVNNYKRHDNDAGREGFNLERDWVVEHIFNSSCIYCGDSNWKHLGADRIDNNLPHTPENCVCSCGICNFTRNGKGMSVEEFVEWRKTHPRDEKPPKLEKVVEINGIRVIKKVG